MKVGYVLSEIVAITVAVVAAYHNHYGEATMCWAIACHARLSRMDR